MSLGPCDLSAHVVKGKRSTLRGSETFSPVQFQLLQFEFGSNKIIGGHTGNALKRPKLAIMAIALT